MEKRNAMFAFVPDTFNQMFVSFLHLLVQYSALQLPPYLFSFLAETFPEYREKKYFADHQTSNAVQLIAAIKENFSGLFFHWLSQKMINVATCLFANIKIDMNYWTKTCLNRHGDVRQMALSAMFYFEQVFDYRRCSHLEKFC